jgi:hypothetical protein
LDHVLADRLAPVRYFRQVQYGLFGQVAWVLAYNRHASRICSGIKLYSDRLNVAGCPVDQLDRKREKPVNLGPAFLNQNPCPGIGARHQGMPCVG